MGRSIRLLSTLAATLSVFFFFSNFAHAELVVVVDHSSPFQHVASDDLKRIYLGKKKTLAGQRVIPIDQKENSESRGLFYEKIVQKTDAQLKSYWSRLIFTGKGQAPQTVADDEAVKAVLKDNPNLIGYIKNTSVDDKVRIIFRLKD